MYAGLQHFSARKGAANFSFEDLRRLRQFTRQGAHFQNQKKIYITVNTIIQDNEISDILHMLEELSYAEVDGVIVQDLGLADIIRTSFPELPLHGSTQIASHTVEGVRVLEQLGFSRVVLSRELTFEEIAYIRKACPDISLKVFAHGALCYSFSGLCLASGLLLGRSGNRGECGQICRTWFSLLQQDSVKAELLQDTHLQQSQKTAQPPMPLRQASDETAPDFSGYFFSMTDLSLQEQILALQDIGIDSIKIEGRMKSPEYTGLAAKYYRDILDGKHPDIAPLQTAFSRESSSGWTFLQPMNKSVQQSSASKTSLQKAVSGTKRLTTPDHPGHRGIPAGSIHKVLHERNEIEVQLTSPLSLHDGIMILTPASGSSVRVEPNKFSVSQLGDKKGKRLVSADKGAYITLRIPKGLQVKEGMELFKISDHRQNLPGINPASYPLYKKEVKLHITITDSTIALTSRIMPLLDPVLLTRELSVLPSQQKGSLVEVLQSVFTSSGNSLFTSSTIEVENRSKLPLEDLYLPLSQLKKIRREWFSLLDQHFTERPAIQLSTYRSNQMESDLQISPIETRQSKEQSMKALPVDPFKPNPLVDLPPRELLIPRNAYPIPFITDPAATEPEDLAQLGSYLYLPLMPVMFQEENYYNALDELVQRIASAPNISKNLTLRIGLNNVSHISWVKKHAEVEPFIDYYLYCANRATAALIQSELPRTLVGYEWIEQHQIGAATWKLVMFETGSKFNPPLFISRSCFRRDSLGLSCRSCKNRHSTYALKQSGLTYKVIVDQCLTYLLPDKNGNVPGSSN